MRYNTSTLESKREKKRNPTYQEKTDCDRCN